MELINRYLRGEKVTPRLLWNNVKPMLQESKNGSILFNDTVLDKRYQLPLMRYKMSVASVGKL